MARKSRSSKRSRALSPTVTSDFSAQLQAAILAHERGDPRAAADIAADILSRQPGHPDALHLLGVTSLQSGDCQRAISLIGEALSSEPRNAVFHNSLGNALRLSGDLASAETSLRKAVKLRSDFVEAWNSLGMVKHMLGRHDEAVDAFERALRKRPDSADICNNLGIAKRSMGELSGALECFENVLRLQPDHAEAHNNLGSTLMEWDSQDDDRLIKAVRSYKEALRHLPGRSDVQRNLTALYRKYVPQWHFPMLNDMSRNDAYDRALREVVAEGDLVLDIGTGSGLLAMMAVRAGAHQVVSCESVKPIADKAKEIVAANGFADRVRVINKQSHALQVGEDLPRPADVLVAEIFDAGLLGEGALRTMEHASESLLKPTAVIIPGRAIVYASLIESEPIYHLDRVRMAGGFDVSAFNEFSFHPAYLQERLDAFTHRHLSESFEVFLFDFQTKIPISRSVTIPVKIIESGTIHGIAFWFDLHLTDEIQLTTAPGNDEGHWQQAIQLLPAPRAVSQGDVCHLTASHEERTIILDLTE